MDLTITSTKQGNTAKPSIEVVHTNQKHPFLTVEKGFLPVGQITVGMHVVEADGSVGVISGWKIVPGVQTMYNLEVAQDHTFTVGMGMWVVHNCGIDGTPDPANKVAGQPDLYKGERFDTDTLSAKGWKQTRNEIKFAFQDAGFEDFANSRGENTMKWRYRIETWEKGNAKIENHYWYNIDTFERFHHH